MKRLVIFAGLVFLLAATLSAIASADGEDSRDEALAAIATYFASDSSLGEVQATVESFKGVSTPSASTPEATSAPNPTPAPTPRISSGAGARSSPDPTPLPTPPGSTITYVPPAHPTYSTNPTAVPTSKVSSGSGTSSNSGPAPASSAPDPNATPVKFGGDRVFSHGDGCAGSKPRLTLDQILAGIDYLCDPETGRWTQIQHAIPGVDYELDRDLDISYVWDSRGGCYERAYDSIREMWFTRGVQWGHTEASCNALN